MLVWIDGPSGPSAPAAPNHYAIIRRHANLVPFEPQLIAQAMMKAFLAVHQTMRKGCTGNSLFYLRNTLTLPLFRVVLNPRFTRPFCAVPRTSVFRNASG